MSSSTDYSVSGKVALITGALGALGTGIAQKILAEGGKVVFSDIKDAAAGDSVVSEINTKAGTHVATYICCDVRKSEDIANAIRHAIDTFGRLDILVNNAGISSMESLYRTETFEGISFTIDINLRAPIEATRQFVRYIWDDKQNRTGVVVNIASMSGYAPVRGIEIYASTKAALLNFTQSSASLAPGVRVSALAPYFVDTPMVGESKIFSRPGLVRREWVLTIDQVAEAALKAIKDTKCAGKSYVLIGNWAVRANLWMYEIAMLFIMAISFFSLLVARIKGIKPPATFIGKQSASSSASDSGSGSGSHQKKTE